MRVTVFLFFLAAMPVKVFSQPPIGRRVEGSIAWSVADRIAYEDDFTYALPAAVRAPIFPGKDARHMGCITGGFMLNVGRGWSFGLAGSYAKLTIPGFANYSRQGFSYPGRHVFSHKVLAIEAKKVYFSRLGLRGYARLGLGGADREYDFEGGGEHKGRDLSGPVLHISPIGVSYGERLRGFVEFGYGYRGLMSLGAALHF